MTEATYVRVLKHVARWNAATVPAIAKSLDLSPSTVRAVVKVQVQAGRLKALGTAASGARCYGITAKGREAITVAELRGGAQS